jgi:predicted lipid-binding transport protein (Tim44 family)
LDGQGFGPTLSVYNLFLDTMKSPWIAVLLISLALGMTPFGADAKRLGGGKSTGLQRDMPARTAPDAAPAKPAAAPQQAAQPPAAAPGVPPKRSWMGPLAGLAAGLGLAALFSHFGLGEGMGSLLTMLLVAGLAFFVIRLLMQRFAPRPALGDTMARSPVQVQWPAAAQTPAPIAATASPAFVPAAFDSEGFGRTAKALFIRLQAANDSADLDDLRRFTTPEMFAELRLDLQERGSAAQKTDVVQVDAQVLDVADDGQRQIVSVRFHGKVVEEAGAAPTLFDEVWHLAKPLGNDSRAWAIAGIEQQPPVKA